MTTTYQSWDWANDGEYFHPGEGRTPVEPRGYALRAIKRELAWLGFDDRPMIDNGQYGANSVWNVKQFQKQAELHVDGVIGPNTMKRLCHRRVEQFQRAAGIPDDLVCRQIDLESAWYPASRNTTEDYGMGQIHEPLNARFANGQRVCPNGDWQYAYRIGVNVRYVTEYLTRNNKQLLLAVPDADEADTWKASIFAYNAPAYADDWLAAGCPATGGLPISSEWFRSYTQCETWFEWATKYVGAVYKRTC